MTTRRLTELLSPYRTFDAETPDELRVAISRQSARCSIIRHLDQLLAARRASALHTLMAELAHAA